MCLAHAIEPDELEGWLVLWFRPALRFADRKAMQEQDRRRRWAVPTVRGERSVGAAGWTRREGVPMARTTSRVLVQEPACGGQDAAHLRTAAARAGARRAIITCTGQERAGRTRAHMARGASTAQTSPARARRAPVSPAPPAQVGLPPFSYKECAAADCRATPFLRMRPIDRNRCCSQASHSRHLNRRREVSDGCCERQRED